MGRIIVALDTASIAEAIRIVEQLGDAVDFYKVGLELYTRSGPAIVAELNGRDKRVFLDLKLHDIPNTVAGTVAAASDLGVELVTVHAAGGRSMWEAARDAASGDLRLLGVTVLTSLGSQELGAVWGRTVDSASAEVLRLAELTRAWGADGVVASAAEATRLRERFGEEFLLVTPGIRPLGADRHDQERIATPSAAVSAGVDYLVVGRPVTWAAQPKEALAAILAEVEEADPAPA